MILSDCADYASDVTMVRDVLQDAYAALITAPASDRWATYHEATAILFDVPLSVDACDLAARGLGTLQVEFDLQPLACASTASANDAAC